MTSRRTRTDDEPRERVSPRTRTAPRERRSSREVSARERSAPERSGSSRAEAKERTRQNLLDEALALAQERSFASLSLREVAKAAGVVPTAFYRHFASMDDLGVTLVEDSMRVLRRMLRDARRDGGTPSGADAVAILSRQVRNNDAEFAFLVREQHGGSPEIRRAIDVELRLFAKELTHDLARIPALRDWGVEDLDLAADLFVTVMLRFVAELVRVDPRNTREEDELVDRTERQMLVITMGLAAYRPRD
ncbi:MULTISPECIES: TetR family transcriptional regulator [unclassified Tsukamurella]|uniref:TetR family transcriptional regulator n=1 Tax=unclassified Tsukamurella TaxID=2633480 RepID=UPI0031BAF2F9